MRKLDLNGIWWLPNESNYYPGNLSFDSEGARLKLSGTFSISMQIMSARNKKEFVILGESIDKNKITLVANRIHSNQETVGQKYVYSETEFQIQYIILGAHFPNVDNIEFDSVLVEFSNLEKWLRFDLDNKSVSVNIDNIPILWTRSNKAIDIVIQGICSVQIFSSHEVKFEEYTYSSNIGDRVYVKFYQLKKNSLKEYILVMDAFRDFLNFVLATKVEEEAFKGIISKESGAEAVICEVLWKPQISPELEKVNLSSYLIPYEEIKEEFSKIVNSWFNFKTELPVVFELYVGIMNNSDLYLTNKFLMTAQAIEVYHENKFTATNLMRQEEKIYHRIVPYIEDLPILSKEISVEDIKRTKTWMNNGKKPSLRYRVIQLYAKYSTILPYLSIKIGNIQCFPKKVSDYRNALTHGKISSKDIDYPDLSWTYSDLQLMLQLCILSQLGFSLEKIAVFYRVSALREVIVQKFNVVTEFFRSDTEKTYLWSTQFFNRCVLPKSINSDPDSLLRIIEGVQFCIDKEGALNEGNKEESQGDQPAIYINSDNQNLNSGFMERLSLTNKQYMPFCNKQEIVGISLALWSGCTSAVRILSKPENGGPENAIRGILFQMIEKLSSERPIYGLGVEVALIWKINHGQGTDVCFEEEALDPHIKKFEKLWNERLSKI